MLVQLKADAKILAVKAGTSMDLTRLPCQPTCLFVLATFFQTNMP